MLTSSSYKLVSREQPNRIFDSRPSRNMSELSHSVYSSKSQIRFDIALAPGQSNDTETDVLMLSHLSVVIHFSDDCSGVPGADNTGRATTMLVALIVVLGPMSSSDTASRLELRFADC